MLDTMRERASRSGPRFSAPRAPVIVGLVLGSHSRSGKALAARLRARLLQILDGFRGARHAFMLEPNDTVGFDQRFATLRSIGECIGDYELMQLLKKKAAPICYVWCDPSPWMHITQGISMTINVNKMVKAGCKVKIVMADWFARTDPEIFGRTGGDLNQMHTIGSYNIEMWKATGMDLDAVEFVRLSDEISYNADEYWPLAMDIARKSDLSRIQSLLRVHAAKDPRWTYGCWAWISVGPTY